MSATSPLPDPSQGQKCVSFFRQAQTEALFNTHRPEADTPPRERPARPRTRRQQKSRREALRRAINPEEPLLINQGRTLRIYQCCVREAWNWEGADIIELEAVEEANSNHWDIRVLIRWEAMWGEQYRPSDEQLVVLARDCIKTHFTENRYPPRFSSLYGPVLIEVKEPLTRRKGQRETRD